MALELKLTFSAVSADCELLTLTDDTQYGGDNPIRADLGVFLIGQKSNLPTEVDVPVDISSNDGNPLTDSIWFVTAIVDGWYTFPMYAVPIYVDSPSVTYTINQVVYHTASLWKCLATVSEVEPGTDPLFWESLGTVIADITTELEAADNVTFNYFKFIVTCRSEKCYSQLVVGAAKQGCCEGCTDAELKQTYERVDVLLNGTFALCNQLKFAEAEETVRNMIHICENSKCVCA